MRSCKVNLHWQLLAQSRSSLPRATCSLDGPLFSLLSDVDLGLILKKFAADAVYPLSKSLIGA